MPAKIEPRHDEFLRTTAQATRLVGDVKGLVRTPSPRRGHPGLPQLQLNLIYELAFVRCVLAWEEFLQQTMCAYMVGAVGLSGRPPKPRAKIATLTIAEEMLIGEGPSFVSWTDKKRVSDRAKLWFDGGEPYYTAIQNLRTYEQLKTVRNRIVHDNPSSRRAFRDLMKQNHKGDPQQGLGPGSYLARQIGQGSRLDAYVNDLTTAALHIATN